MTMSSWCKRVAWTLIDCSVVGLSFTRLWIEAAVLLGADLIPVDSGVAICVYILGRGGLDMARVRSRRCSLCRSNQRPRIVAVSELRSGLVLIIVVMVIVFRLM